MKTPQAIIRAAMDNDGPGEWSARFDGGNGWTASMSIAHEGYGVYVVILSKQQDDPLAREYHDLFYRECKEDGLGAAMHDAMAMIPSFYRRRIA